MNRFNTISIILLVIYLILNVTSIIIQKRNKKRAYINFIISSFCAVIAIVCIIMSK